MTLRLWYWCYKDDTERLPLSKIIIFLLYLFFPTGRDRKQMSTCINSLSAETCLPSQLQLYTIRERISSVSVHPHTHNIQYSIKSFRKGKHLSLFPLCFLHLLSPCARKSHLNKAGPVAKQQLLSAALSGSERPRKRLSICNKSLWEALVTDPFHHHGLVLQNESGSS